MDITSRQGTLHRKLVRRALGIVSSCTKRLLAVQPKSLISSVLVGDHKVEGQNIYIYSPASCIIHAAGLEVEALAPFPYKPGCLIKISVYNLTFDSDSGVSRLLFRSDSESELLRLSPVCHG